MLFQLLRDRIVKVVKVGHLIVHATIQNVIRETHTPHLQEEIMKSGVAQVVPNGKTSDIQVNPALRVTVHRRRKVFRGMVLL